MDFCRTSFVKAIISHYKEVWGNRYTIERWDKGKMTELFPAFCVLVFPPHAHRNMWTYATCGMSDMQLQQNIELHLFSSRQDDSITELLTAIAYYHKTGGRLDLEHTINFGRPWQDNSSCTYGYISLPYLDGPELENFADERFKKSIRFYWLIPITDEELAYKKENGAEALEEIFDSRPFNYVDTNRTSLIGS